MTCNQSLHNSVRNDLQFAGHTHGKEGNLGKTVGQGTSISQRGAVFGKPADKIFCKKSGSVFIVDTAFRILCFHKATVNQAIVMKGKGDIIILFSILSVKIPAVSLIAAFDIIQILG